MIKSIKEQWIEEHREAIEKAYPRFVRNIEKQNRIIEEKVEQRNRIMASHKPGDILTGEERALMDFNPYACSGILDREFRKSFGRIFEGCPFQNHKGAIEKILGLNISGLFRYSLSYYI